MLLLWVEYIPHVFIGASGLIVAVVALDFTIAKIKSASQRLRKAPAEEPPKPVETVTNLVDNAPIAQAEAPVAPDVTMEATVEQEQLVRDTGRCMPMGAPTERYEPIAHGADTERHEPIAAALEPVAESAAFSRVGEDRRNDSASLVAMAARELMQARSTRVEDAVVTRDPSVRIVDVAVASSGRVAS
ncbi:MAG: hypothetical protein KBG84_14835 [Planctomycetes bacterium]|nr:hypothetical protein [Planctomycetota bacterium]